MKAVATRSATCDLGTTKPDAPPGRRGCPTATHLRGCQSTRENSMMMARARPLLLLLLLAACGTEPPAPGALALTVDPTSDAVNTPSITLTGTVTRTPGLDVPIGVRAVGGQQAVEAQAGVGGTFALEVALQENAEDVITVSAWDSTGSTSNEVTIQVRQDSTSARSSSVLTCGHGDWHPAGSRHRAYVRRAGRSRCRYRHVRPSQCTPDCVHRRVRARQPVANHYARRAGSKRRLSGAGEEPPRRSGQRSTAAVQRLLHHGPSRQRPRDHRPGGRHLLRWGHAAALHPATSWTGAFP